MLGVIPLGASSVLPPVDTVPAPESNGVAGPDVTYRLDDAEYGGAVAIVDAVVESSLTLPNGVGFGGTADIRSRSRPIHRGRTYLGSIERSIDVAARRR